MKVSALNPKDTTLDEIHAIQEAHYEQQKGWSFKRLQAHYRQIIEKISDETGTEIKVIRPNNFVNKET